MEDDATTSTLRPLMRLQHGALAHRSNARRQPIADIDQSALTFRNAKNPRYRTSGESLHPATTSSWAIAAPQAHAAGASVLRSTDTETALPMISSNTSTRRRASSRMIVAVKSANGPDRMRTR